MLHKNRLQACIITYVNRRDELREKYPDWASGNKEYKKTADKYAIKIKAWRRSLKVIEEREQRLKRLDRIVCEFIGIDTLKRSSVWGGKWDQRVCDARKLFVTYALEHKMGNNTLAFFLGCLNTSNYNTRRRFKATFKTNKVNLELWQRFKLYVEDYEDVVEMEQLKIAV